MTTIVSKDAHTNTSPKPDLSWTRPPKSRWMKVFWRWRIWVEVTFALSMLEPWEKFMLVGFFASLNLLLLAGIIMYFPAHLASMRGRAIYYLWGTNSTMASLYSSTLSIPDAFYQ